MKMKFITIILFLIQISAFAQDKELSFSYDKDLYSASSDIVFQAKMKEAWTPVFIKRLATYLKNLDVNDPFNRGVDTNAEFTSEVNVSKSTNDVKSLLNSLSYVMNVDVSRVQFRTKIENISYSIQDISSDIKLLKSASITSSSALNAKVKMSFENGGVKAKKVTISVDVFKPNSSETIQLFDVTIVNPELKIHANQPKSFVASTDYVIYVENQIKMKLNNIDFSEITKSLNKNPDQAVLSTLEFETLPDISISAGNSTINIDPEKIKKFIIQNQLTIKNSFLTYFTDALASGVGEKGLKSILEDPYERAFSIHSNAFTNIIRFDHIIGNIPANELVFHFTGNFCSNEDFTSLGKTCVKNDIPLAPVRVLNENNFELSKKYVETALANDEYDFTLSASENFINRLINKTIDIGSWNESLDKFNIKLGPKKAFVVLDQTGRNGKMIIDIVYPLSKFTKFILGIPYVRVPLIFEGNIRIKNELNDKGIETPYFVITAENHAVTKDLLLNGLPEFGIESNLKDARFKKRIAKMILKNLSTVNQLEAIKIDMPFFNGMNLHQAEFESDGQGRAVAKIKLKN